MDAKIWQVVDQQYEGYDVLATYVDEKQANDDLATRIETRRQAALIRFHELREKHYPKWTEEDYLDMHDRNSGLDVYEFDITSESDREASEVLSTIPVRNAASQWADVYIHQNASVFMIDGKLWIYPKSGGLIVIEQLLHISGDVAPFSD